MYDLIIVGAGPAGLTAAIYAGRKKMKTLVASMDKGGLALLTQHIENYPGFTGPGPELMKKFEEQANKFGAEFVSGSVNKIEKKADGFIVSLTNGGSYESRTVILSYGSQPRALGIPGEKEFYGKGVSTCATCDAPLFAGKTVAVIGGGNTALESAELLSKFSKKVYLVHRRDEFRGDEILVERLKKVRNIEFVLSHIPVEIEGGRFVNSLTLQNVKSKKKMELKVDGVFIEIGYEIKTDFVRHLVKLNKWNEIIVDKRCATSHPGIFAAGDITDVPYKQVIIAAGQGATAALSAYNHLQKLAGKAVVKVDW
jgi:thioredoxin-disulfide reductase